MPDAVKDFPSADTKLFTEKGLAFCQKVDIFKEKLVYQKKPTLRAQFPGNKKARDSARRVLQESLGGHEHVAAEVNVGYVVGQDSLTRFDKPKSSRNKNNKNRNKNKGPRDKAAVHGGDNNKPRQANKPRSVGKSPRDNAPKSDANGAQASRKKPYRNNKPNSNNKPNNENQQDTPKQ